MTRRRSAARFFDPTGVRYGIPTWPWRMAPEHLRTRRQLAAAGQRAALAKALKARRVCPDCGRDAGYVLPRHLGTCLDCADRMELAA
ncbi:hypothetical protein OHR68_03780 [Spirillospora sp. NBC_00431]